MTSVVTPSAIAGAMLTRAWTWSFQSAKASLLGWPETNGHATLSALSPGEFGLETPGILPEGVGSANFNNAIRVVNRWVLPDNSYPNPGTAPFLIRLILIDSQTLNASTYFDTNGGGGGRVTIQRNGTNLQVNIGEAGGVIDFTDFIGGYVLIDFIIDGTNGSRFYVNGVDLSTQFIFGALSVFTSNFQLALMGDDSGANAAYDSRIVFAGLQNNASLTLAQHRADAAIVGVLADGLAIDQLGFTWAWSPNRADATGLPAEPLAGGEAARLSFVGAVSSSDTTDFLLPEGLGKPRIDHAMSVLAGAKVQRTGFVGSTNDYHIRIIFKVSANTGLENLFYIEDPNDPTVLFGVQYDAEGQGFNIFAPSGYQAFLFPAALTFTWHLLDISLQSDNGFGQAQFIINLDGLFIATGPYSTVSAPLPTTAVVTLFNNLAQDSLAVNTDIAFVGFANNRLLSLGRNIIDTLALGIPQLSGGG